MNVNLVSLVSTACLSLLVAPSIRAGEIHSLVNVNFNTATTRVGVYPPDPGVRFVELASGFSAWSVGGQLRLTQGPGYGVDGTGGVFAEILKNNDAKFYQITFQKLKFSMLRPGLVIREAVRSLRFSIDAKIPAGKEVLMYVTVDAPKELMPETPWSTRLVMGTLKGTDDYKTYTLNGAGIPEETVNVFINYIRDLQLNGMAETVGSLVFHLQPDAWAVGDGLLLDNVKFEIAGK